MSREWETFNEDFRALEQAIGGGLHFKPGSVDVIALLDGANEAFRGRVYIDMERHEDGRPIVSSKGWLKGKCPHPDHDDHNPSFGIHVTTGACNCLRCGSWKFGELLMLLDAYANPVDQRLFPSRDAVQAFFNRFRVEGGAGDDPLARLRAGDSILRSPLTFAPDIERAELGIAEWAHQRRATDAEGVERALREFDRLRLHEGDEDAAFRHFKRVLRSL